jgi:alkylation response protein AidB-like acyl-CoA dehydrogenase
MNDSAATLLATIRRLAPSIRERSTEIEAARELPRELLTQLIDAGCFRLFVPQSHGGLEIELPASLPIFEALAEADASTAWTAMIGAEAGQLTALLPRSRYDALYANGPNVMGAGSFTPAGRAKRVDGGVDGGFVVSGRWPFASGCLHSQWLVGNCVVFENGKLRAGKLPGLPETRFIMVRADQARILDNWYVSGLKGTGSNDFEVDDLHVPMADTFDGQFGVASIPGALYIAPAAQFPFHVASVAVGIAQRALDDIIALAQGQKRRLLAQNSLAETPVFQYQLARAEISLRAARGILHAEAASRWAALVAEGEPNPAARARATATCSWVTQSAAAVVDTCYTAAGGTAVYDTSPFQRHLRDIRTLTQHIVVADGWLTRAGAAILGLDVGFGI